MATMVKKTLRFDWSTIVLSPPCSPGPGQIRTENRKAEEENNDQGENQQPEIKDQFKIQVGDGMHDSQVTLRTGQDVKTILYVPGKRPNTEPDR
ncbi:hypothetical protein KUCAC02_035286 [Chaenocephalus aceratus]|nr:hypothetical protein KUCAC02_035286 [Chaenocephalus aceratus]